MTVSRGSRSSCTSTLFNLDPTGIRICSRSAWIRSIGAASTSTSLGPWSATPSSRATSGRVGACSSVNTTTKTSTMSKSISASGTIATIGTVARMIGTAPRSPAQDRNACSRQGTLNQLAQASTDSGRATTVRTSPAASAMNTAYPVIRRGSESSPSITNSPIWAIQPIPSAKERVAARCGSRPLPSSTAQT